MSKQYRLSARSVSLIAAFALLCPAHMAAGSDPPEVGKELSKTAGISLLREPGTQNSSWLQQSQVNKNGVIHSSLSCGGRTLAEIIENVAGVPKTLVHGADVFPAGTYTVKITAANDRDIKTTLFRGLESAFGVHVREEKRKLKALVLKKAENWDKSGFKPSELDESRDTASGDGTNLTFDGVDMDRLAAHIALALGKAVLNETGIKGRFQGTLPIDGRAKWRRPFAPGGCSCKRRPAQFRS